MMISLIAASWHAFVAAGGGATGRNRPRLPFHDQPGTPQRPVDAYNQPLDYNPCLGCNLCVAACPVGAISNVREFDGQCLATVENGQLTTGVIDDLPVDATVVCDAPDYIRILHRTIAGRRGYAEPANYTVDGDPAAVQHLLLLVRVKPARLLGVKLEVTRWPPGEGA